MGYPKGRKRCTFVYMKQVEKCDGEGLPVYIEDVTVKCRKGVTMDGEFCVDHTKIMA